MTKNIGLTTEVSSKQLLAQLQAIRVRANNIQAGPIENTHRRLLIRAEKLQHSLEFQ